VQALAVFEEGVLVAFRRPSKPWAPRCLRLFFPWPNLLAVVEGFVSVDPAPVKLVTM